MGSGVLEACPLKLKVLAAQSASSCLGKPEQICSGNKSADVLLVAEESIDDAIEMLLAIEPRGEAQDLRGDRRGKYLPFDTAVLWGVLAAFAYQWDAKDGASPEQIKSAIHGFYRA